MDMRAVDVLTNIKNWPAYDYKAYKLDKHEANPCMNALENYIWHDVEKEGLPKEDGFYLFKCKNNGYGIDEYYKSYYYSIHHDPDSMVSFKNDITHWRKIVDEKDAYYE